MSYRCETCGKRHEDLPHVGIDQPDPWWDVAEEERDNRSELTSDTRIIDGDQFFIRGVIEIPVHELPTPFGFGVWISQKRENFFAYLERSDSAEIGPFFGWLCTRLACYQEGTLLLKTMAHFRGGGLRPAIVLEPTDHPLAVDQRHVISLARAWEDDPSCVRYDFRVPVGQDDERLGLLEHLLAEADTEGRGRVR